ncbi:hypothetical protein EDC01DRAFT_36902 [Geopyxis carbonaria]|nr:hypothetical protein EDC01DRAFT_36902 [Geopyxis carbonaria]
MPEYIIEHAKTGRASCRTCRKLILAGEVRLGQWQEPFEEFGGEHNGFYKYRHWGCVTANTLKYIRDGAPLKGRDKLHPDAKAMFSTALAYGFVADEDWRGERWKNRHGMPGGAALARKAQKEWEDRERRKAAGEIVDEPDVDDAEEEEEEEETEPDTSSDEEDAEEEEDEPKPKPKPKAQAKGKKPATAAEKKKAAAAAAPKPAPKPAPKKKKPAPAPAPVVEKVPFKRMTRNSRRAEEEAAAMAAEAEAMDVDSSAEQLSQDVRNLKM